MSGDTLPLLDTVIRVVYLLAAVTFVLGLHFMRSPVTARRGNLLSASGMACAVVATVVLILAGEGHGRIIPIAAIAPFAARAVLATALVHVRQQRQLTRALDGASDLHLMAPARAGDPARADLALLRDELAQRDDILVVDLVDLVAAVLTGLAPSAADPTLLVAPANRLAATACLGHQRTPPRLRS